MSLPPDANVRQQALDITQSFAVSAPAGSGKTGLLTQRVLALLAQCEQPENVLAITFTRKAAAEMQQRILAALVEAKEQSKPPAEEYLRLTWELATAVNKRDQALNWQLHKLPQRLRITTIDGFCRHLSQQLPLSSHLGTTPEVLDAAAMQYACQLAIRETLAALEQEGPLQEDLARLIRHFNNQLGNLENLFTRLLMRRDQWLGPLLATKDQRQFLESTLKEVVVDHLTKLHKNFAPFASECLALADYASKQLQQAGSESAIQLLADLATLPDAHPDHLHHWQALAELCLTQTGQFRKTIDKRQGFPAADSNMSKEDRAWLKQQKQAMQALLTEMATMPLVEDLLHGVRELPSIAYTDTQWQLLDALTRVLTRLVAQLSLVFQQLGKTDYIDITLQAIRALGDEDHPSDLALALDYRIQHILVDEFQDTSSPQLHLLQRLTAGWQMGDGRSLFLVGDAMQSCYSFRDANVGIFLDCRQHGLGDLPLIPLDLCVNFRSQAGLVDWFNSSFNHIFPAKDDVNQGAVAYQQAQAFKPLITGAGKGSDIGTGVNAHLLVGPEKPTNRKSEAEKIIQVIQQAQQLRPEDSIAILVRKRQQVSVITQGLTAAGITYKATEIDRLDKQMLVQDLLTLTRALLYPNDRIAWLSLLRAPWCGLDLTDLQRLANFRPDSLGQHLQLGIFTIISRYQKQLTLSHEGELCLGRFAQTVAWVFAQQGRRPLHQWVESAWLQLGAQALLLKAEEDSMVDTFLTCLQQHSSGWRINNWQVFEQAVKQLFADNSVHSDQNQPAIEIMTIHKAKGLEFDTVIMPGLDLLPASDGAELLAWQEWLGHSETRSESQLIISPVHSSGNERDSIYDFIRYQQSRKQQLEADRLLYVGCTRAIKQLHLLGWVNCKEAKDSNSTATLVEPPKRSMLASLWPLIKDSAVIHYVDTSDEETSETPLNQHPNKILRLMPSWQRPAYPRSDLLADYRQQHFSENLAMDNRAKPDALLQRQQRYFGTVLHLALQQVTDSGYQHWDQKRVSRQLILWQQYLQQLGLNSILAAQLSKKIAQIISNVLRDDTGCWLVNNQHDQSACEFELRTLHGQSFKQYILDRTFIDSSTNTRWIIDYKSSEPADNQTLDDFLCEQENNYRQQLANYTGLLQQFQLSETTKIRTALYFPCLLVLREIDLNHNR